jgi:hypothetical protein
VPRAIPARPRASSYRAILCAPARSFRAPRHPPPPRAVSRGTNPLNGKRWALENAFGIDQSMLAGAMRELLLCFFEGGIKLTLSTRVALVIRDTAHKEDHSGTGRQSP